MASIIIHVPDQEALEYDLDAVEQLTFGRGPDNDVVIEHVSMSGSHAMIQNLGGSFQLTDLGSTNGTYVNGAPITEAVLESGARIQFGSVEAVFVDGEIVADAPAEGGAAESGAGAGHAFHAVEMAEVSNRPADFKDLSPIEKVVKKDVLSQVAMLIGVVALLAAIALIALSFTMKAA